MKKIAVYPGSFDPITKGHIDIIKRSCELFDKVIVGVLDNPNKKYWFDSDERLKMVKKVVKENDKIKIERFQGLLVDFMKEKEAVILVRGLRAVSDYEYELQLHLTNKSLANGELETIFLPASRENLYLSSSLVKEIATYDADLSDFIPKEIEEMIREKAKGLRRD